MSDRFNCFFSACSAASAHFTLRAALSSARALSVLLFTLALLLAPLRAHAQANSATLQGTVVDASGAAVDGAQIAAANVGSNAVHSTTSNSTGAYLLPPLAPGVYNITVTKTGFATFRQTGLTLEVGQIATLDPTMKLGSVSEVVEVKAEAAQIQTADSTLGGVITERETQDLPLNGRMFTQLLQLEPGTVAVDVSQNNGKQPGFGAGSPVPGVNGGANRSNLFYIDGVFATDPFFAGFSFSPSIDAIQEFKEQTHTDQAEYGGSTGATVTVVTLPGTNSFHGSAFEFFRNDVLDARNTFAENPVTGDPTKLPYKQNQFGATFAGPIIKNKLFFFAYYEGGRQVEGSSTYSTVPTAAERNGDFSGLGPNGKPLPLIYDPTTYNPATQTEESFLAETGVNAIPANRIDKQMQTFLNGTYPMPNTNAAQGNYVFSQGNRGIQDQGSIRMDYNLGPNDTIYGRFSKGHATNSAPQGNLGNLFETGFSGYNTGVNWVHTVSPSFVTTVTLGINNLDIPQAVVYPVPESALFTASGLGAGFGEFPGDTSGPQVPALNLQAPYTGFWNGSGPIGPMTTGQVTASATKVVGDHELKFGGGWYKTWLYTNWNGNNDNFSNEGTWNAACQFAASNATAAAQCPGGLASAGGDPVASALLSVPIGASQGLGNSGVSLRMTNLDLFAQDSWKLSRKFTVNLGLRWDYNSPVTEKYNRVPTYDIYTQTYLVPDGDANLPSGALPAGVALSGRDSITNPRYGNFSPRIGLAYQIAPKTVIRAGFGRSFDSYSEALQTAQQNRGAWPSGLSENASGGNVNTAGLSTKPDGTLYTGENPFYGTPTIPASPLPAFNLAFGDVRWQPDSSWQWNLQVQHDFNAVGIFSLAYVGSETEHTTVYLPYNQAFPSALPCPGGFCAGPDTVLVGHADDLASYGTSNYEALQANLSRPLIHGFGYNFSFTWSHTMAIANCGDFAANCVQNLYDIKADYGPSALNVPLVASFSVLYELPFGKGKQYANEGAASAILGGWQLNTIVALRSGLPFNVTNGENAGDTAHVGGGTQRPDITSNPYSGFAKTTAEWFDTADFVSPAVGSFGDAGINPLRGPDFRDVDFSVLRTFAFTEKLKLQFRAEIFDLFNHPNYANPNTVLGNSNFGAIPSTVGGNNPAPGANRDVQFALKLIF